MPLAPMFVDPMITPFRKMLQQVEASGLGGPDVEEMRAQLSHMEQLAQQMDDIAAYSGRLTQDQTFHKFSDAYGRALASAARARPSSDEELLASALGAYQSALESYRGGEAGDTGRALIPHLERILALGRSGVSYPVFLRRLDEEGLNAVLDGSAPLVRAGLEQELDFARETWDRHGITQAEQLLATFDELAAEAPHHQPDPLSFARMRRRVEWELAPLRRRDDAVVSRWQYLLALLVDWLDAFTRFAPSDPRWRPPGASEADVRRNIERTRECAPGELRFRLALFERYFRLGWEQIWRHETFVWEYTARRVEWSDERLQLIRATFPHCRSGARPPDELVRQAEALHPARDHRSDALRAPAWGTPLAGPP